MEKPALGINITRRQVLFKIIRVVTSKLIKGQFHFATVSEISAADLNDRITSGQPLQIIDTRSASEFGAGFGHIPNSRHIPMMEMVGSFTNLDQFKQRMKQLEAQLEEILPFKEQEVITICPGGGFSLVAAEILAEAGFTDVKSLSGGADGWFKQGFPTTLS